MIGSIVEALFKSLEIGLRIWDRKEKRKYLEQMTSLRKRISDEEAKDLSTRDQNVIDRCHRDLLLIVKQWSAEVEGSNPTDKP